MAERRSVRSSSRRMTPTPQPPSAAATPQAGRVSRTRGARSVSRDVENAGLTGRPTRRTKRQDSIASQSENEKRPSRQSKRKAHQQPVGDLAPVEEVDTQLVIEDNRETPPRSVKVDAALHRSPGAVSEMSGTTAISSFSMVEAEDLDVKAILRRPRRLYESANEMLEHLVPDNGRIDEDREHYIEIQKPDSDYTIVFRDLNCDFSHDLSFFKSEHQDYIRPRAVHRALLGPERDLTSLESGLNPVLHKANLVEFTKTIITSDRNKESTWNALRMFDNTFPSLFLFSLVPNGKPCNAYAGESAMLMETFEVALELRTQLAILVLYRSTNDDSFDPDVSLDEVFFHPSPEGSRGIVRGWDVPGLGGKETRLDNQLSKKVAIRVNAIREYFTKDTQSLERGETVDFDNLFASFSWEACILQVLHWVRLRNRELDASIKKKGGIDGIAEGIKAEVQHPDIRATWASNISPRKKRTSFGRERRRSNRKFDPNAQLDSQVMDKLLAREKGIAAQSQAESSQQAQQPTEQVQEAAQSHEDGQDEWQPAPMDDQEDPEVAEENPSASAPPRSTADIVSKFKEARKIDKENRGGFIARQPSARQVEFGDGFDETQIPTASSSTGKQPQKTHGKRRRPIINLSSDEDEDAFETNQRESQAKERRQKAPVKKARFNPASSMPPSHQPPAGITDGDYVPEQQEESFSEEDAPEMMEEIPTSSYADFKKAARINTAAIALNNTRQEPRRSRTPWSADAEEALLEYMKIFPQKYSDILTFDKSDAGYKLLDGRTQVNLKDKVRNMAITMIKSGVGLKPGFQSVILPSSKVGEKLLDEGFKW
ncbi:uncharacterized protein BDR25DRAFT_282717 [Lindgomyces ingoldianus]|uniref:Uncharacterized protein n=1 Tax=Lindgomyces ingoldianus TaxID=673940 RepID=A0ACB6R2H5_9PLEO|nr:uncharacterized protein BDR25DRAFT_282717 [Lindgomyces ingoldianus]KAF2473295.1 hypothetical protein BDR25DRAFT_282717 [Lindgomyces ingoldianus]